MSLKVLITGAHFTPAVAVIEQLKKYPDVNIVYVGRKTTQEGDSSFSQESRIIPKLGVKFIPIITGRLQRSFSVYTIPSLLKIPIGLLQALYIIFSQKPDVILSFGGYVAVPVVFSGWLFSIPILVHEQTLVSGLANNISSLFADKVALSFKSDSNNQKYIFTGNPLREVVKKIENNFGELREVFNLAKKEKLLVILITGGNQGSHIINKTIEDCLDRLTKFVYIINKTIEGCLESLTKLAYIIHVTGDNKYKDFERLEELGKSGKFGGRYLVKKWIGKEYVTILKNVDLAVSRSGINTLTELAYLGKPALVIPLNGMEQYKNAKYFEKLGLVKILPQSKLSSSSLIENIMIMLKDLTTFNSQAVKAKQAVIPDAAKRLALEVLLLIKSKNEKYT